VRLFRNVAQLRSGVELQSLATVHSIAAVHQLGISHTWTHHLTLNLIGSLKLCEL
jgi:hypothetical protein